MNRPSTGARVRCASASTTCATARQRIIAAADAERRRIERDLHDGAQQRMVAVAVTLGLAESRFASDPEGVARS